MSNEVKPEQVPDIAVEAAAMARYADQCAFASQFQDWPAWDDLAEQIKAIYRSEFRLQIAAALNAWPGMHPYHFPDNGGWFPAIILPLTENTDAE